MKFFGKPEFVITFLVFIMSINFGFSADTLNIISPNYFSENNNVYEKINYLENEILSFEFCSDKETDFVKFSVIPDSGKDIELQMFENKKKPNCYFTNYALEKINSDEFRLEVFYSIDNKEKILYRNFKKQKQSKLINHILGLDYEILNPVDLSYYLTVLNDVESSGSETSVLAYEKLKNDRNNKNKCWPKDSCKITDTSKILRNLILAGYSQNSRLLEDGETYLDRFKISNENNPTRFDITVDNSFVVGEKVTCGLKIDNAEEVTNYEFDKDSAVLTKYASKMVSFACNQTIEEIKINVYSYSGKIKESREYINQIGFSKSVDPFSCIGSGTACEYDATIDALIAYGGSISDSGLLSSYIDSLIIEGSGNSKKLDTGDEYKDTGKYLYFKSNAELSENLRFSQNNDGSWGSSSIYNDIEKTAWSVLGLQKVGGSNEYVSDGKKWIYFNEPSTGWGNVEKNSLAYMSIKEQIKPYLKINPISEISEKVGFVIENPTIHNLKDVKVTLGPELNEYVSYTQSLGDLEGKGKIEFEIKVDDDFYSQLSGSLKITGVDGKNQILTLVDMPINLVGPTPISFISGNYSITPEVPTLNLGFIKNVPNFDISCNFVNPFDGKTESVKISSSQNEVPITNFALKEGNFVVNFDCSYNENKFSDLANISVDLAEVTFRTVDEVVITGIDDFSFFLNDSSSDRQTITFEITGTFRRIIEPAEESKLIAIGDSREIFFKVTNPVMLEALGNTSTGNLIIKSSSGYKKSIPILVDFSIEEDSGLAWWAWILIVLLIGFIGLVIFRFYELKQLENSQEFDTGGADDDFYFE